MSDTAIALLSTGERIPLSDPLDEARRHWRDGEYDTDVIGIEHSGGAETTPISATESQTAVQVALL